MLDTAKSMNEDVRRWSISTNSLPHLEMGEILAPQGWLEVREMQRLETASLGSPSRESAIEQRLSKCGISIETLFVAPIPVVNKHLLMCNLERWAIAAQ